MFSKLSLEQTTEENDCHIKATQEKLELIYQHKTINYTQIENFALCKSQLLALLDYIAHLNPSTLQIFSVYRDKIERDLLPYTSQDDIDITLNTAKKNIEDSLLIIEKNHSKIDSGSLAHYVVDKCFSGAFSNITSAISHFYQNAFVLFVDAAKKQLLLDLIALYATLYDDTEILPGNEIHFANSIYNEIAETFGCTPQKDPLILKDISDEDIEMYKNYIIKEFTVARFIQKLTALIPLPSETKIDSNAEYEKIKNFFDAIKIDIDKKSNLYIEDEDGYLSPRQNFSLYLECLIAFALEAHGYIKDAHYKIANYQLFDNGSVIVNYNQQHQFQCLTDVEVLYLLEHERQRTQRRNKLVQQLSPNVLHIEFKKSDTQAEKNHYFRALLNKNKLPENIIQELVHYFFFSPQHDYPEHTYHQYLLAQNIFENFYSLPDAWIRRLASHLNQPDLANYFSVAVSNKSSLYTEAIYHNIPCSQYTPLCIDAAKKNKPKVIRALAELGINLNDIIDPTSKYSLAHIAATQGNIELLDILIAFNVDFKKKNISGYLPVHAAAIRGRTKILEKFYALDADSLNAFSPKQNTVAHLAAWWGHVNVIEMLHHYKLNLNARNTDGCTPAHAAAYQGHLAVLEKLYNYGVNINTADNNLMTIAHIAAMTKNKPLLKKISVMGVDMNAKNNVGVTPGAILWLSHPKQTLEDKLSLLKDFQEMSIDLNAIRFNNGDSLAHVTVAKGDDELLEHLIKQGIDLDTPNHQGYRPAHTAAQHGNLKILERLHSLNTDQLNTRDNEGGTIAHVAAKYRRVDVINMAHHFGIDLNTPDFSLSTVAHIVAHTGDIMFLAHLKKLGVNLNMPDNSNRTPGSYFWRCIKNTSAQHKIAALKAFKELSLDFNAIYSEDDTPLVHLIANLDLCSKDYSVIELLDFFRESGANLLQKNSHGQTLAHLAAQQGNHDILKYLYHYGMDLNIPDNKGNTVAHIASMRWSSSLLEELLSLNVDFNKPNKKKMTPIYIAATNGRINNLLKLYHFYQSEGNTSIDWKELLSIPLKNSQKFSFAHLAAQENSCDFLRLLKTYDISHAQKNKDGTITHVSIFEARDRLQRTAIFSAVNDNNKDSFSTLVQLGANLNVIDKNGNSLAHIVCKKKTLDLFSKLEWLELLAQNGVKLNSSNHDHKTPLDGVYGKQAKEKIAQKINELSNIALDDAINTESLPIAIPGKRNNQALLPMYNVSSKRPKIEAKAEAEVEDEYEFSTPRNS